MTSKKMISAAAVAFALAFAAPIPSFAAEVRTEPEVQAAGDAAPVAKARRVKPGRIAPVALGRPSAAELAQVQQHAGKRGLPTQVGFGRPVADLQDSPSLGRKLDWETLPDGAQLAAISIDSPEAAALRVGVRVDALPTEATLRFYAISGGEVFEVAGAEVLETIARNVEAGDHGPDGRTYWSPVIEGSTIVVELEVPGPVRPSEVRISVPHVSHLVTSAQKDFALPKASAACHNDASCSTSTWGNEINSVARMLFNVGSSSYLCTGTLVADRDATTAIPYFLTANHCISSQTSASTLNTYWFYRSSSCNSGGVSASYQIRTTGATLLYNSATTDTSFLRLNSAPPTGAVFAGWLIGASLPTGTDVTGIHHPGGDPLKISFGDVYGYVTCTAPVNGAFNCSNATAASSTFYDISWRDGVTEGGSSGSGLFQDNGHYLVGQLYGGSSSCLDPTSGDVYGRLDVAYNAGLSQWLNPQLITLTVTRAGGGSGTIASTPSGINCGATCSASFTSGTTVSLGVIPDANSSFTGWSGSCTGTGACNVMMNASTSVTATFLPKWPVGGGMPSGWISSAGGWSPITGTAGVDTYEGTAALKSNPIGNSSSAIVTYTGQFSAGTGSFARKVSSELGGDYLRFYIDGVLMASWSGTVAWAVQSFPIAAGVHTFKWAYEKNAANTAGSDAAWIDAVYLPANTTLVPLSVARGGTGSGTVSSAPGGISCGATCNANFALGSGVTFTATPAAGSTFAGWSGGSCAGAGACTVSMSGALLVTATFNVSAPPPGPGAKINDLSGDAKSDILIRDTSNGVVYGWIMNGLSIANGGYLLSAGSGWQIAQVADLDGDGKADIVIQHTDGSLYAWIMDGLAITGGGYLQGAGTGWTISHVGDFNGDGKADLLLKHTDGSIYVWLMDGATITGGTYLQGAGTGWSATHVADFNGDGKSDILLKHTNGSIYVWQMNGAAIQSAAYLQGAGTGWSATATGDFNGDGKADVLITHTDGSVYGWQMNGTAIATGAYLLSAGSGWSIAKTGDLDGDGKADILIRQPDGSLYAWLMNGLSVNGGGYLQGAGTGWSATHLADLNGDGKTDILLEHTDGSIYGWLMNGATIASGGYLMGAGNWRVTP